MIVIVMCISWGFLEVLAILSAFSHSRLWMMGPGQSIMMAHYLHDHGNLCGLQLPGKDIQYTSGTSEETDPLQYRCFHHWRNIRFIR